MPGRDVPRVIGNNGTVTVPRDPITRGSTARTIVLTPRFAPKREPQMYPYTRASARLVRLILRGLYRR